jgi:hypothetical protein
MDKVYCQRCALFLAVKTDLGGSGVGTERQVEPVKALRIGAQQADKDGHAEQSDAEI